MGRETIYLYILVRPLEFSQPRLGNWHWSETVRRRRRIDSSSIIAHPVNFDIKRERSLKCDTKNSTHTHTHTHIYIYMCVCLCVYITLSVINRYRFSLSIGSTKNHKGTLTRLKRLLKYVNIFILGRKLTSHACALLIDNVGNYLYLNNRSFIFEVDLSELNQRLHHLSQFQRTKK